MARGARIGIIGCGNISDTYFTLAPLFKGLKIVACADIKAPLAKAKAETYGVAALTVDGLLKNDEIDTVINLTDPRRPLRGDAARSSRPASTPIPRSRWRSPSADARKLVAEADRRGVKLGGAPDTFLGAGGADRPAADRQGRRSARSSAAAPT